jgi:hypothetical protein
MDDGAFVDVGVSVGYRKAPTWGKCSTPWFMKRRAAEWPEKTKKQTSKGNGEKPFPPKPLLREQEITTLQCSDLIESAQQIGVNQAAWGRRVPPEVLESAAQAMAGRTLRRKVSKTRVLLPFLMRRVLTY